ncbi:alcohol phosphatidyl transferase [Planoprotostelium fungivorum]|uniref:Alcohol phosphatidyl transferase n=1 Tax=Planoprotostelium fungivorum TaxID=1890364 RepID=A0A2P6NR26_9EUKA|nr:alcohol phosphatidyl transferase [Planoprotostelium fungivorum]
MATKELRRGDPLSILGPFISSKGAKALLDYTYHGQDHSILAPTMYKIWAIFFYLVPKGVSPNVVTLSGLAAVLFAVFWANLGLASSSTICYILAVSVFIYQTADALDGMQGRRVGMYQNPTTEMFDHGVDSCVTVITALTSIVFVLELHHPVPIMLLMFSGFIGFHAPTYEHLITNTMVFRGGPTNPTEALVITQLILILAGTFPWIFHLSPFYLGGLVLLAVGGSSLTMMHSVRELNKYYKGDQEKTMRSALAGWGPLIFVILVDSCWFPFLGEYYQKHNMLCLLAMSVPWNYSIFRTILQEITSDKDIDTLSVLYGQTPALIPLLGMVLGLPFSVSVPLSLASSLFIYMYTVVVSLREVCDALGMEHFWSIRDERLIKK